MLRSVEGIYRNGRVELLEVVPDVEETRVIVTFIPARTPINLQERGIDESQAADLRARLKPFAEDWERAEMDAYDEL